MKKSSFNYLASQENTALLLMSLDSLLPWEYKFIEGLADECSKTDDWDRFTREVVHTLGVHPFDGFKRPRFSHETVADFVSDLWQAENTYHTPDRVDEATTIYNLRSRIEEDMSIPYGITPEEFVQEWNDYCDYQEQKSKVNTWYILVNEKVLVTAEYNSALTPSDIRAMFRDNYTTASQVSIFSEPPSDMLTSGVTEMTLHDFEFTDMHFHFLTKQIGKADERIDGLRMRAADLAKSIDYINNHDLPAARSERQSFADDLRIVADKLGCKID